MALGLPFRRAGSFFAPPPLRAFRTPRECPLGERRIGLSVTCLSRLSHLLFPSLSGSYRQTCPWAVRLLLMAYSRSAAFAAAADSADHDSPHPGSPASRAGGRTPTPPAADPAASQSSGSSRLWTSGFPSLQVSPWLASAAEGRLRAYAVWVLPGHPELRGVHLGGPQAWRGLQDRLPGRSYSSQTGTRLRAFPTAALAIIGYLQEAEAQGAPDLAFFRWYVARHH